MKLPVPFIQLPLLFDAGVLADEIAALGEDCWRPHPQGYPGNSMLPLLAVDGDPDDEGFAGAMRPTPYLARCPYLMQTLAAIGAVVGRTRLMRLSGHAEVTPHVDQAYYWAERVRVHVPVVTQPTVRFDCGDASVHMAAGECWIFDTWRRHRVLNDAEAARIHLVVDTVGGDRFSSLLSQGRAHDQPWPAGRQPTRIAPDAAAPAIACESTNAPAVMTPWELNAHLGFLFGEAMPDPRLPQLHELAGRFSRSWRALWSQFGDAQEGRAHFRATLDEFLAAARGPAQGIALRNELLWFSVLVTLVGKVAVADGRAFDARGLADNG
ncbi:MAG: aspartyl beta-hydroxylase [Lysobacter sp.]|nr:aspartyl beta-hydroxylase [Lysobacter sp.]